ncbi:MAG: DJ-1/PfpI family protein [Clostridia bacterium]|nr:DJ-1/PfpI family protein [Clostridia bacterium]
MVYLFLAEGFEEVEALTPVDYLRRAGISVTTVGIGGEYITGAHGITVKADVSDKDVCAECSSIDMVVLPGGMPGTLNLAASETVCAFIKKAVERNAFVAAICAAPSILGEMGLLAGKEAICYPGFEEKLIGAAVSTSKVVRDGNVITAKAAGCADLFAAELIAALKDKESAEKVLASVFA